jgi:hypothetical protein
MFHPLLLGATGRHKGWQKNAQQGTTNGICTSFVR